MMEMQVWCRRLLITVLVLNMLGKDVRASNQASAILLAADLNGDGMLSEKEISYALGEGILRPSAETRSSTERRPDHYKRRRTSQASDPCLNASVPFTYLACKYGPGNTEACGFGTPSCSCLVLWTDFQQLVGEIPIESIVQCRGALSKLFFTAGMMTGPLPSAVGNLSSLEHLYISSNQLSSTIPTEIGRLNNLNIFYADDNSLFGLLPSEMGQLHSLRHLTLARNRLTGPLPETLASLENLEWLSLKENFISGFVPIFRGAASLRLLSLGGNVLSYVPTGAFEDLNTMHPHFQVDISYQNIEMELAPGAFRGIRDAATISVIGNFIPSVPYALFGETSTWSTGLLTLVNLGIERIEPNAFQPSDDAHNVSIDLTGNYVVQMGPNSFGDNFASARTDCVSVGEWSVTVENNQYDCADLEDLTNCLNGMCTDILQSKRGAGDLSALRACCNFGGGYTYGNALVMESSSPVTCRPSYDGFVVCECGNEDDRYDTRMGECVSSCGIGHEWSSNSEQGNITGFTSDTVVGHCESCSEGMVNPHGEFDTVCVDCAPGTVAMERAMSACTNCPPGRYSSIEGGESCISCPDGTRSTSEFGSKACVNCIPGKYSFSSAGVSSCASCSSGWYSNTNGSTTCKPCPAGSKSEIEFGSSVCEECESGKYSSIDGLRNCASCAPGRFSNGNATSCDDCDLGYIIDMHSNGTFYCSPIIAGFYGNGQECPMNTYSTGGATACSDCSFGKHSSERASECMDCDFLFMGSQHCTFPLMGTVVFTVLFMIICAVLCLLRRCYRQRMKRSQVHREERLAILEEIKLRESGWTIEWSELVLGKRLANGAFGEVWLAKWKKVDVAVKIMFDSEDIDFTEDAEIQFLERVRHPRLVCFFGRGMRPSDEWNFIVLEFMARGSLTDFLYGSRSSSEGPKWSDRLTLLRDVAEGMSVLHDKFNVIHRDLKSANVLLDEENDHIRAKVADFGLSRVVATREKAVKHDRSSVNTVTSAFAATKDVGVTMTAGCGTPIYMAPEILTDQYCLKTPYTKKVDVYAFGIIMWETAFLLMPWHEMETANDLEVAVKNGKRPHFSEADVTAKGVPEKDYVDLMKLCWAESPSHRPAFVSVFKVMIKLSHRHRDLPTPPLLNKFRSIWTGGNNGNVGTKCDGREIELSQTSALKTTLRGTEEAKTGNDE